MIFFFFFSSRRRHTRLVSDWSSDVCSSDLGPEYERLLAGGVLVLQLHQREVGHHHGRIGGADGAPGAGMLLWFGEVADFDGVVERAGRVGAPVTLPPHRNPPEGGGNGPGHREIWITDPDGYTVVVASPDGEAYEHEETNVTASRGSSRPG